MGRNRHRVFDKAEAIQAWSAALRQGREVTYTLASTRAMPDIVGHMIKWRNYRSIDKWCVRTTQEVVDSITQNRDLAAAITAQWGTTGAAPTRQALSCMPLSAAVIWKAALGIRLVVAALLPNI